MKPNKERTHYHHRFYRYTRMMLRRYPMRCGHPMMLVGAMGNKSVRAIVSWHLGKDWRKLFMDLARSSQHKIKQGAALDMALLGAKRELDAKCAMAVRVDL